MRNLIVFASDDARFIIGEVRISFKSGYKCSDGTYGDPVNWGYYFLIRSSPKNFPVNRLQVEIYYIFHSDGHPGLGWIWIFFAYQKSPKGQYNPAQF